MSVTPHHLVMDAMCDRIVDNLVLMLAQRAGSRMNFASISFGERYFFFFFLCLFAIVLALAFFLITRSLLFVCPILMYSFWQVLCIKSRVLLALLINYSQLCRDILVRVSELVDHIRMAIEPLQH